MLAREIGRIPPDIVLAPAAQLDPRVLWGDAAAVEYAPMKVVLAVLFVLATSAGCRGEDETCTTLAKLCPHPDNYAGCRSTLAPLGTQEARHRHQCMMAAKTCNQAMACANGLEKQSGWEFYKK
jgi:hypothetical protein